MRLRIYIPALTTALAILACLHFPFGAVAAEAPTPALWEDRVVAIESAADAHDVLKKASGATLVLLGEASHGTSEFYTWRTALTLRLIEEHDFRFIVVEGDWAAAAEIDLYIKGKPGAAENEIAALQTGFQRWPKWMWANRETAFLVKELARINATRRPERHVGFFGMDVYDHERSMDLVRAYVQRFHPSSVSRIERAYACLDPYRNDMWEYVRAVASGGVLSCEESTQSVVTWLEDRLRQSPDPAAHFDALQNARVVQGAERHFRSAASGGQESWNARVEHMAQTIQTLLDQHGQDARGLVWAHNTHVGDARATEMARYGHINIGKIKRKKHGPANIFAVGFGTERGTVLAGSSWGSPRSVMSIPPASEGSYEHLFATHPAPAFYFLTSEMGNDSVLQGPRGHRAIGVVYNPNNERGNYVSTRLLDRYDAFFFIRRTSALEPLSEE